MSDKAHARVLSEMSLAMLPAKVARREKLRKEARPSSQESLRAAIARTNRDLDDVTEGIAAGNIDETDFTLP